MPLARLGQNARYHVSADLALEVVFRPDLRALIAKGILFDTVIVAEEATTRDPNRLGCVIRFDKLKDTFFSAHMFQQFLGCYHHSLYGSGSADSYNLW